MKQDYIITNLKGGSLSSTNLFQAEKSSFVRKSISLVENREYGFQRWYSQLKKIQRYNEVHPELFPKLLNYGIDGDNAFFDISYCSNSLNLFDYLSENPNENQIKNIHDKLIDQFSLLHQTKISTFDTAIDLYFREEVNQKLKDCGDNKNFNFLVNQKFLIYNGVQVKGIYWELDDYLKLFQGAYYDQVDCLTHGNATLENILYDKFNDKIIFIDPYEENIVDTKLAEYSQVLQSSSGKYEYLNRIDTNREGNKFYYEDNFPNGLSKFNEIFNKYLEKLRTTDLLLVKLFEISQFIRMLPFKKHVNENKMLFFYAHASYLYHTLKLSIK